MIGQELEGDVAARMLRHTQPELLFVPNEVLSHWGKEKKSGDATQEASKVG